MWIMRRTDSLSGSPVADEGPGREKGCGIGGRLAFGRSRRHGLTLVELLVCMSIIAVLIALLLPTLSHARAVARHAVCAAHQRQIGLAIHSYAFDHAGVIPLGPEAPSVPIASLYLYTGHVTNLVSLENAEPVGLGLLLEVHLSHQPRVLFCPASDQPVTVEEQIAAVGQRQVQGSYFYRHGSVVQYSYPADTSHIRLANMGLNRQGEPIRALTMDGNLLAPPMFHDHGIFTRTHHETRNVNVLYTDGHVQRIDNEQGHLTVDLAVDPHGAPDRILQALEFADGQ